MLEWLTSRFKTKRKDVPVVDQPAAESLDAATVTPEEPVETLAQPTVMPTQPVPERVPAEAAPAEPSAGTAPSRASAPARSPAEAFAELSREVGVLRAELREVTDYVRRTGPTAMRAVEAAQAAGAAEAVGDIIDIHHSVCRLLWNLNGGSSTVDESIADAGIASLAVLRGEVENNLLRYGVETREPRRGESVDLSWMSSVGTDSAESPDQVTDTVSRTTRCGYVQVQGDKTRLIGRAEVVVFVPSDSDSATAGTGTPSSTEG